MIKLFYLLAIITIYTNKQLYASENSLNEDSVSQSVTPPIIRNLSDEIQKRTSPLITHISNSSVLNKEDESREVWQRSQSTKQEASAHPLTGLWGIKSQELDYVFRYCNDLVCIIDADGRFEVLNQKWHEILGWQIEELIGTPYVNLIHPKDVKKTLEYRPHSFQLNLINRFRCKDGSYRWLNWLALPDLGTSEGSEGPAVSFAQDITLQKELEHQNKKKMKQLNENILNKENLLNAMYEIQAAHTIEMFSTPNDLMVKNKHTLQRILSNFIKLSESELGFIGEVFYDAEGEAFIYQVWDINASSRVETAQFFEKVRDKFIRFQLAKTFLNKMLLSKKPIILKYRPADFMENKDLSFCPSIKLFLGIPFIIKGELIGLMGLANRQKTYDQEVLNTLDFLSSFSAEIIDQGRRHKETEFQSLKREQNLAAASEAKSTFVAHMSHEIRTPLSGLLGMLDLIDLSYLHDEDINYLKSAQTSGLNLLHILNDVLDLSKIEAKQLKLEAILFNPRKIAQEVEQLLSCQAKMKNLKVKFYIDSQLPDFLIGDPTRLRQILTNLLSNAVKFTHKGKITCRLEGESIVKVDSPLNKNFILRGSVRDTGIGMSSKTQDLLFKPFAQGDSSITRKFGGTGLGLYITKQLCEMMEGKLRVVSKLNKGSKFYFKLFMSAPESLPQIGTSILITEKSLIQLSSLRILIAEDNTLNQKILQTVLLREGCKVAAVWNGREALRAVQEEKYDLVLMDGQMPEMDGIEATQKIREIFDLQTLPIIGVTAHAMVNDREKFLSAGMNGYLTKPIQKEVLKAEIIRCCTKETVKNK